MNTEIVRRIAARFGVDASSIERVRNGHINDTFLVAGAPVDAVMQRLNRTVFADIDGITANIDALCAHLGGTLVPRPLRTGDGRLTVVEHGDVWRAWQRVDATAAPSPAPRVAAAAGDLLGRFHAAVAELAPSRFTETIPHFHDPASRLRALRDVVARDPCDRAATVEEEIASAFANEPLCDVAADVLQNVPRRVAHNDAKLDNMLFRGGDAVYLVDLDTVMPGAWCFDIGDLVRSAATTAAEDEPDPERAVIDPQCYDALIGSYRLAVSKGPVTAAELDAIDVAGAIVTYEQAVRFLTDWLAGDVYYRTERPHQNRDRSRAQFHLLASMPGPVRRP